MVGDLTRVRTYGSPSVGPSVCTLKHIQRLMGMDRVYPYEYPIGTVYKLNSLMCHCKLPTYALKGVPDEPPVWKEIVAGMWR